MNRLGYIRVASVVPAVSVGDPEANAREIARMCRDLDAQGVDVAVFPEMSVTGYTCADLFHNRQLLESAYAAMRQLAEETTGRNLTMVVGAPAVVDGQMYNCAAVIADGAVKAVYPKTHIPNYNEFYEKRWWRSGGNTTAREVTLWGFKTVFGRRQLFEVGGVKCAVEICEDLWAPVPPSCEAALGGAEVVLNLSASDALTGKYDYLRTLVKQQSARCLCAYVYCSAGYGESSTDLVFDGIAMVAENGSMLGESARWNTEPTVTVADVDVEALRRDRMHLCTFGDCAERMGIEAYPVTSKKISVGADTTPVRKVNTRPFVPAEGPERDARCQEIVNIQASGLMRRLQFTHCKSLVVGISGGLDSTLALLVAVRAFDRLGLDRRGITGVTMPGFGTTDRTHDNAVKLMELLGVTTREISIVPAVEQHFSDIGHDASVHDVTYENAQARQRTYLLMDIANQAGGMVLGTGDLSELALGWATYNGDHMSMYGVNAGVPKTLVKHLVRWFADTDEAVRDVLLDIVDTPISPELIPAKADGTIEQKTEDLVGPYDLHDFFLYYMLRYGFTPGRVYAMAEKAFEGEFDAEVIKHWLRVFYKRFFAQQFKRSCLPDGPKIGSVCLSPRGDWRMPSDATSAQWLKAVDEL